MSNAKGTRLWVHFFTPGSTVEFFKGRITFAPDEDILDLFNTVLRVFHTALPQCMPNDFILIPNANGAPETNLEKSLSEVNFQLVDGALHARVEVLEGVNDPLRVHAARTELKSFLDPLDDFTNNAVMGQGCIATDPLYQERKGALEKLRTLLGNGSHVLICAPPASGKTSLLQAFARKLVQESPPQFYPVILRGRAREAFLATPQYRLDLCQAVCKALRQAKEAGVRPVLIVDEGQRLYPVLDGWAKELGCPMIVAASYYYYDGSSEEKEKADSPVSFDRSITPWDLALTDSECEAMFRAGLPTTVKEEASSILALFKFTSKLSSAPPPSAEHHHTATTCYHAGLFRLLLSDLDLGAQLEKSSPTFDRALDLVYGNGIENRAWFRRIFKGLTPNSKLRTPAVKAVVERYLFEPSFNANEIPADMVAELVRSTLFWKEDEDGITKLHPTTPLVDRLLFLFVRPASRVPSRSYTITSDNDIDQLIIDVVRTMSIAKVAKTSQQQYAEKSSSWAAEFYYHLAELLPLPHTVAVETMAKGNSNNNNSNGEKSWASLEMYIPTLNLVLFLAKNGERPPSSSVVESHRVWFQKLKSDDEEEDLKSLKTQQTAEGRKEKRARQTDSSGILSCDDDEKTERYRVIHFLGDEEAAAKLHQEFGNTPSHFTVAPIPSSSDPHGPLLRWRIFSGGLPEGRVELEAVTVQEVVKQRARLNQRSDY